MIHKKTGENRVLVLMSGGVDSSVTALVLKNKGFDVTGVTMVLYDEEDKSDVLEDKNVKDAKKVAKFLNINHIVLDLREQFKKSVIDYFVSEYLNGRTPNPCVMCNKCIKFGEMLSYCEKNNFNYIATGHYAHVFYDEHIKEWMLGKAKCSKDQSYVLYSLKQENLKNILMLLWNMEKSKVRNIARKYNIPVADKKESQDICFIKNNDYVEFIKNRCRCALRPGYFIDSKNNILGKHNGIFNYTVGQRKGLGASFGKPMYVTDINSVDCTITLGEKTDLLSKGLIADNVNIVSKKLLPLNEKIEINVKIRYKSSEIAGYLAVSENNVNTGANLNSLTCKVVFKEPTLCPIAKGQSVVFYKDDIVLGGGVITSRF